MTVLAKSLRYFLDASFWWMACIALAMRSLYQPVVSIQDALVYGLGHTVLYRALYELIVCRFSVWRLALLWLGSPLLIFSATWLRPVWAIFFTACWALALWWSSQQQSSQEKNTSNGGLAGYLIVLAWVSMCGAGGYGFQSWDYQVHNGRLLDLIHYSWPVSYVQSDGSVRLMAQYIGYYIWPALAGKLAGESVAMLVQHLWLLAGCWLALRVAVATVDFRSTWLPALGLTLFGGWSLIGLLLFVGLSSSFAQILTINASSIFQIDGMPVWLSFWPATQIQQGVWFGNFISLASSMLWAPNQIVAGWLVVGLLCRSSQQQTVIGTLFVCSLLAFWSPMIAIGVLPIVLVLLLFEWRIKNHKITKSEIGVLCAGFSVLCVLGAYYASVPVSHQPHGVLSLQAVRLLPFVLFCFQSWGIYVMLVVVFRRWLDKKMRLFACAVFTGSALVSCVYYGVNNDLLVRTSAALYFGIWLIMLAILRAQWNAGSHKRAIFLVVLLSIGAIEGVLEVWQAAAHADVRIAGVSLTDFEEGWQYLGRQDSWFVRHLSAELQTKK